MYKYNDKFNNNITFLCFKTIMFEVEEYFTVHFFPFSFFILTFFLFGWYFLVLINNKIVNVYIF